MITAVARDIGTEQSAVEQHDKSLGLRVRA